jgi:hypothetical protein
MRYFLIACTLTISINLHAQTLVADMERERIRWDKLHQEWAMAGVGIESSYSREYSKRHAYTIIHRIKKKEYQEFKKCVKDYAKLYLCEALTKWCSVIEVVVKTGGIFGNHVYVFNVDELVKEVKAQ